MIGHDRRRAETRTPTRRATLVIHGLVCGGGSALTVERALQRVRGVTRVYVNPLTETAHVDYDPCTVGVADLAAVVRRYGDRTTPAA